MEDVRKQHIDEQTSAVELFAGGADEDEDDGDGAEKSDYAVDGKFRVRDANKIAQTVAAVMRKSKSQRRQLQEDKEKENMGPMESAVAARRTTGAVQDAVKTVTDGSAVEAVVPAEEQEKGSSRYMQEVRLSPELLHAPSVGDD